MGSFKCSGRVVAIDTEDDGDPRSNKPDAPGELLSVQVVGEGGERRYFRRRDTGGTVAERAEELRTESLSWVRGLPPADLWACNATYDAVNLGLLSRGVTATRASGGYTAWTHPRIGHHRLFDTRALSAGGAADMGDEVGLPKLVGRAFSDPEYAMRDADIVCRWIVRLRDGVRLLAPTAELRATIGGTAAALWRAMGGEIAKLPVELRHAARAAYYGGRVEVFRFDATGPAEVWDMRSAFPAAMARGRFPVGDWIATRDIVPEGIYRATVRVKGPLGALPVRCNGANVYPVGRFSGTWFGEELCGPGVTVERVEAGWRALEFADPFGEYVALLWAARHGPPDSPMTRAAKLLLNSLYGVVGHNGVVAGLATVTKRCKLEGRYVAPGVIAWTIDKGPSLGTNAAWAGIITARARRRLLDAAQEQAGRLVYMDTDSLYLTGHLGADLGPRPQGEGLGDWRLVSELDDMQMEAPKVYAMKHLGAWAYVAKGVSRKARGADAMSYAEEFVKYARTRWRAPLSPIQAAIRHEAPNSWRDVERTLRAAYRARFVHEDGRTSAWDAGAIGAAVDGEPWRPDELRRVEAWEAPTLARTLRRPRRSSG